MTFNAPFSTPPGSTYSLLDEYVDRFSLRRCETWEDPYTLPQGLA